MKPESEKVLRALAASMSQAASIEQLQVKPDESLVELLLQMEKTVKSVFRLEGIEWGS